MSTDRERALRVIDHLPDDADWASIIQRLQEVSVEAPERYTDRIVANVNGCCGGGCDGVPEWDHSVRPCDHYKDRCGRHRRLNDVLAAMDSEVRDEILSLGDHKGGLLVGWKQKPTEVQKSHVIGLWISVGRENGDGCEHAVGVQDKRAPY